MDLSPYIATLREDLATAASAGDEQTRRTATVLAAALEPAARLAIMNALSDLAAEVTAALEDRVVELRLDGRDVRVTVSGEPFEPSEPPEPPPPPPPPGSDFGGDVSRITLRLLEEIKGRAEQAAASQGVSLNAWLSQAVQGALNSHSHLREWSESQHRERHRDRHGHRMRGWVQG
jgi:HicB family